MMCYRDIELHSHTFCKTFTGKRTATVIINWNLNYKLIHLFVLAALRHAFLIRDFLIVSWNNEKKSKANVFLI